MACMEPPLLEVPHGNWYCDDCFDSSDESDDDSEELEDLNNDIEEVLGQLPESRLRTRQQQPVILRTMQSERIRNAIIARMSLRSAREALSQGPSTSSAVTAVRKPVKRRVTKRRRRPRTVVVEYGIDGSDKFAMKTRKVKRRSRKKRKARKISKTTRRGSTKAISTPTTNFKGANKNVHELQRSRTMAGLNNFNIFQPTNQLDYIPDDGEIEDSGFDDGGGLLTQAIVSLNNPQRRTMSIKNRVLLNCTTTSSSGDLLDSIMQDQDLFGPGSIQKRFAVEKSSGKLVLVGKNAEHTKSSQDTGSGGGQQPVEPAESSSSIAPRGSELQVPSDEGGSSNQPEERRSLDDDPENLPSESLVSDTKESPADKKKKPKKPAIDMFDENPSPTKNENPRSAEAGNQTPEEADNCPNFSIYDSVDTTADQEASSSFQIRPNFYDEENVDLVQMSDNEQNESSEEAQPAIVASQPASPDLENDKIGELVPERSYTPPIAQKTSDDAPDKDDSDRKRRDRESKRNRKRELERYNVRDRLQDRSPVKIKDKFGRNRSRTRSSSRKKKTRRRSRSLSRDRYRKSRSRQRKSRSFNRSRSRRRTPSIEYERKKRPHKEKAKRMNRRSRCRSRSFTPKHHRPITPDRKARSKSKKSKRKRQPDYSKEKLTKEVFTSGENILVSVNFNNQEDKSAPKRPKSHDRDDIVDITARKKITVSSKPVAIIDLSPFRELTPEYQSNVIELSDSEGERPADKRPPKSPDSTRLSSKLYDPFDILHSPANENVTSSAQATLQKQQEKAQEPTKTNVTYNKNIMTLATSNLFFNEENLVSSSSTLLNSIEKLASLMPAPVKIDSHQNDKNAATIPMDIAESPYSPGHEYDDSFPQDGGGTLKSPRNKQGKGLTIFDELFGSATPPCLDRLKSSKKTGKLRINAVTG